MCVLCAVCCVLCRIMCRPFWISPRQLCVVPVSQDNIPYGEIVRERMFQAGFEVVLENSKKTLNKKVRAGTGDQKHESCK